jgi:hypothetical protein
VQHLQGVTLYHPRAPMVSPDAAMQKRIKAALKPVLAA